MHLLTPLHLRRQPFRIRWSGLSLHELPAVTERAAQVGSPHPVGLVLLRMAAGFLPDGHRWLAVRRDTPLTTELPPRFPRRSPSRQVLLLPGDTEHPVAARAPHVDGVAGDGGAGAARGAHAIAGMPAGGRRLRIRAARTGNDGPLARPTAERLEVAAWYPHLLAARHLKDGFIRRESNNSIPRPSSQPTAQIGVQARPLARERFAQMGHTAQGEPGMRHCQSEAHPHPDALRNISHRTECRP
jgi:hypothetical protein